MTTSPEQAPHEAALFRTIREWGITRGDNGVVGGVVEGLGDRIGMARVPARIIVVVAAIVLSGLVFFAYAAAWALLPDRKGNIIVQNFGRGIPNVGALIGIAVLTLMGLGNADNGSGLVFNSGTWGGDVPWSGGSSWSAGHVIILVLAILIPLIVVGGIITAIVLLVKKNGSGNHGGAGAAYAAPPVPTGSAGAPAAATPAAPDATSPGSPPVPATDAGPVYAAVPPSTYSAPPARHHAPAPPAPPAPPKRPRVPGPGRAFYLLTLAWATIAAAAAAWFEREGRLEVHPVIAGAVLFVIGLGIILIAISLAGRKLGFLGFIGIVSLVPLMVFAGNAESLRTAYAQNGGITYYVEEAFDPTPTIAEPTPFDATLAFGPAYANVFFNASCYETNWEDYRDSYSFASVQRLDLQPLIAHAATPTTGEAPSVAPSQAAPSVTTVDIVAELTYISVAKGASITLDGGANAMATVVFADKGFQCDFQPGSSPYMELTNPDAPIINLVVADDQYANTIVIQEVAS